MLRAVHSWNPRVNERLELARADTSALLHVNVLPGISRDQFNHFNKPGLGQAVNLRIQLRVIHGVPPVRTITGQLPTDNPEGPKI